VVHPAPRARPANRALANAILLYRARERARVRVRGARVSARLAARSVVQRRGRDIVGALCRRAREDIDATTSATRDRATFTARERARDDARRRRRRHRVAGV
jgi:hypothetical protein